VEPEYVSFEQLDREHREERLRDAERVRKGEITPEQLQAENSIFPINAKMRIVDLAGYLKRACPVNE